MKKYVFQFALGVFLVSAGGVSYAAVNTSLPLPPSGNVGDILTAEYWNQVVVGVKELDNRTREVKTESNGNTAIGEAANRTDLPVEKLDVRGAIKIGNTANSNAGAIRYTGDDFEGYTNDEWKSLTKGDGGDGTGGGQCTAVSSGESFTTGTATASCSAGSISYAAVEWEAQSGKFFPSFALSTNPLNTAASLNCLGNACKVQLICCAGGAGTGGTNDVLAQINCNNDETVKWDGNLHKWKCSSVNDNKQWVERGDNIFRESGNVGIGTSDPKAKLEILSATENQIQISQSATNSWGIRAGLSGSFIIRDDGVERMRIKSNGNVGIGTSNPTSALTVTAGFMDGIKLMNSYNRPIGEFVNIHGGALVLLSESGTTNIQFVGATNGYNYIMGNLGIGITNPSEKLEVDGNIKATAFLYSSDERLKTNIIKIKNPLEKIAQLKGVTFDWKDSGKDDIGVIAQDVEKIFPQAVQTGKDGYKAVDYARLVPVLIEAINAQQAEIDELKKQINQ